MTKFFSFTIVRPAATKLAGKLIRKCSSKKAKCSADDDYYSPTDWERDPTESDTDYEERTQDLTDWLEGSLDIVCRKTSRPDPRLAAKLLKRVDAGSVYRVARTATMLCKGAKVLRFVHVLRFL